MWTDEALDESCVVQEFARIMLTGFKEDPAVHRATMAAFRRATLQGITPPMLGHEHVSPPPRRMSVSTNPSVGLANIEVSQDPLPKYSISEV